MIYTSDIKNVQVGKLRTLVIGFAVYILSAFGLGWFFVIPIRLTGMSAWIGYLVIPSAMASAATFAARKSESANQQNGSQKNNLGIAVFGVLFVISIVSGTILFTAIRTSEGGASRDWSRSIVSSYSPSSLLNKKHAYRVTRSTAKRAAATLINRMKSNGLLEGFHVSRVYRRLFKGRLVWVGYLEYDGFSSWYKSGAAPGYVIVSLTDPDDAHLVTKVSGRKITMKYLDSAWFDNNARRMLWNNGGRNTLIGDLVPKLGEHGVPYLVAPIYRKNNKMHEMLGYFLLNTLTGKIERRNYLSPFCFSDTERNSERNGVSAPEDSNETWWNAVAKQKFMYVIQMVAHDKQPRPCV